LAHQGRKGGEDYLEDLEQHARILSKNCKKQIKYIDGLFEEHALKEIIELEEGKAIMMRNVRAYEDETTLENNRFYPFCEGFDIYVNDAFSVSHRKQGSIIIPPKVIPSCIGRGFEREINALSKFTINNKGKGVYLLGGQKVEDYLTLFNVLDNKNNKILASGVLTNLILIANGKNLGYENTWMKEKEYDKLLPKLKELYDKYKSQIVLPIDFAVGNPDINKAKRKEISLDDFPTNEKVWDAGKKTVELFKEEMQSANVIFMKGPLGYSEIKDFLFGTLEILKEVSKLSKQGAFSLLGGGHLTTTAEKHKISGFGYVSNSGGALISFVSGEKLPGIDALEKGIEK
jgi:phosphoglycerate kinase